MNEKDFETALSAYLEKFKDSNESLNFVVMEIAKDAFLAGYHAGRNEPRNSSE